MILREKEFHFQSPNHRGVDCNAMSFASRSSMTMSFQSPNHRGVDCNLGQEAKAIEEVRLSVP